MKSASTSGFTLLEVLVALLVLGLIVVGLRQGVSFGRIAWNTEAGLLGRAASLDPVDRALRRMIGQAEAAETVQTPALVGDETRMAFATHLPQGAFAAGFPALRDADVVLSLDSNHRLLLSYAPHWHVRWLEAPARTTRILIENLTAVVFSYYRNDSVITGPGGWQAAWRSVDLPALVRIRLVFAPGDPRHWPDIIAATRLNPFDE